MASLRALVVGGTGGIGYALAVRIASESAASRVIISGRNKPSNIPTPNIEFKQLDASSMRSIKTYAAAFRSAQPDSLDLLILTQGILTMAGRTETPEGIDNKMALHYYGRQLLIRELLPALKQDAKVLIVLDGKAGKAPSSLYWDDLDLKKNYSIANAANHCITMTDAMVQAFAAKQEAEKSGRRQFMQVYPGIVATNHFGSMPRLLRPVLWGITSVIAMAPETCAEQILTGSRKVAAQAEKSGRFWSCIDNKGNVTATPHWSAEQIKAIEEHTWKICDEASSKA